MLDFPTVRDWRFGSLPHDYAEREVILYALAVGAGRDPVDPRQLSYVHESRLQALPSMAAILCAPGPWMREARTGIDADRVVHGEHDIEIHHPLPVRGSLRADARVTAILDKGPDKGAIVEVTRGLRDAAGRLYTTQRHVSFCRGDGGYRRAAGDAFGAPVALPAVPDRPADAEHQVAVDSHAALLYRLLGDFNPLHADPVRARQAGFPRPILHGLCLYGMATYQVVHHCCADDAARLRRLAARFSAPVYPGEVLRFRFWHAAAADGLRAVHLQVRVDARDVIVLNHGWFEFAPG